MTRNNDKKVKGSNVQKQYYASWFAQKKIKSRSIVFKSTIWKNQFTNLTITLHNRYVKIHYCQQDMVKDTKICGPTFQHTVFNICRLL